VFLVKENSVKMFSSHSGANEKGSHGKAYFYPNFRKNFPAKFSLKKWLVFELHYYTYWIGIFWGPPVQSFTWLRKKPYLIYCSYPFRPSGLPFDQNLLHHSARNSKSQRRRYFAAPFRTYFWNCSGRSGTTSNSRPRRGRVNLAAITSILYDIRRLCTSLLS